MKKFLSTSVIAVILLTFSGCSENIVEKSGVAPIKIDDCSVACTKTIPSESAPQIEQFELEAGMYYGFLEQKKKGTPDDWVHILGLTKSSQWRSIEKANNYECDCDK